MTEYQEKDLKDIKDSIEFNKKLLAQIEEKHKTYSYTSIDSAVSEYDVKANIAKEEDILEIYNYTLDIFKELSEKSGKEVSRFNLCDILTISIDVLNGGHLRIWFALDDEIHNKLYDKVFGSHSGIGEWVRDTVPVLMDPIVGSSDYCHAFGTFSMLGIKRFFDNFNKWYDSKENNYFKIEARRKHVKQAKKIIDWLKNWSTDNSDIKTKFGTLYKNYIDLVLEANPEDDY